MIKDTIDMEILVLWNFFTTNFYVENSCRNDPVPC